MKNWLNTGSYSHPHPDPGILTWRVWHLYNDLYLTKNRADLYKSFVTVVSLYKQTPVDFWKSSEFWVRTLFRTPDADYRSKPNSLTCMAYSWAHSAKENVLCPEFSNTTCWFTFFVTRRSSPVHSHELHSMTNCNIKYNMNSVLLFLSVAYHASICLCKTLKHRVKIYRRCYMRDDYTKYTQTMDRVFFLTCVLCLTLLHISLTRWRTKYKNLRKPPKCITDRLHCVLFLSSSIREFKEKNEK